jgi:hypothetical protein
MPTVTPIEVTAVLEALEATPPSRRTVVSSRTLTCTKLPCEVALPFSNDLVMSQRRFVVTATGLTPTKDILSSIDDVFVLTYGTPVSASVVLATRDASFANDALIFIDSIKQIGSDGDEQITSTGGPTPWGSFFEVTYIDGVPLYVFEATSQHLDRFYLRHGVLLAADRVTDGKEGSPTRVLFRPKGEAQSLDPIPIRTTGSGETSNAVGSRETSGPTRGQA